MRAIGYEVCIFVKQIRGRAVFLDDDDYMLNLRNLVLS